MIANVITLVLWLGIGVCVHKSKEIRAFDYWLCYLCLILMIITRFFQ